MENVEKRSEGRSLERLLHDMGEEYESFLADCEVLMEKIKEGSHADQK